MAIWAIGFVLFTWKWSSSVNNNIIIIININNDNRESSSGPSGISIIIIIIILFPPKGFNSCCLAFYTIGFFFSFFVDQSYFVFFSMLDLFWEKKVVVAGCLAIQISVLLGFHQQRYDQWRRKIWKTLSQAETEFIEPFHCNGGSFDLAIRFFLVTWQRWN